MLLTDVPRKFNLPFAKNAGGSFTNYPIPDSAPGTPGLASLSTGFPPVNFTPISAGGIPPAGADFNAILYQTTSWNQWQSAGGPIFYDATFQASIGGYPNGAVVQSLVVPGNYWQSTIDNNTSNPDAGGANWITPSWAKGTGEIEWRAASVALPNRIILNGTTVGNAGSGASQAASSMIQFVYQYLWNNFSNTQCPVSGGRGANALADFNAGKTITTLNMQATSIAGVDGMGGTATNLWTGVPIVSGSVTVAGSIIGENLHTLITAELAAHTHANTLSDPTHFHIYQFPSFSGGAGSGLATSAPGVSTAGNNQNTTSSGTGIGINNASQGGGSAHNNTQRSMLGYFFMHY